MRLSEVGIPGQRVDILNGGDVAPTGRLLSVAEIQEAFRDLRDPRRSSEAAVYREPEHRTPHTSREPDSALLTAPPHTSNPPGHDAHRSGTVQRDWIAVVAAHSGAGASCVALALADALSAEGRACRLIEAAHPCRSGLVTAAEAELGFDPSGCWRRGSRRMSTVYRRADEDPPEDWPGSDDAGATIVDLGLPSPRNLDLLRMDGPRLVVTCRVSVPGIRLAEYLLAELSEAAVVLAAVGAGRWPGEVTASTGPRMQRLRAAGRVVSVPEDRRLHCTGPTTAPLPKPVAAAGRALLALLDAAGTGATAPPSQSAPPNTPPRRGKRQ
jgi:hypothetical protein